MLEITYQFDPSRKPQLSLPNTAAEAQQRLEAGNREFVELFNNALQEGTTVSRVIPMDPRQFGLGDTPGIAPPQTPFAAVLSCSDALGNLPIN